MCEALGDESLMPPPAYLFTGREARGKMTTARGAIAPDGVPACDERRRGVGDERRSFMPRWARRRLVRRYGVIEARSACVLPLLRTLGGRLAYQLSVAR